ncbi:Glyoxalase-like domain [Mycobacteroides abscessus subsp. abscessus]|uniref:VOC family protein n=1 Tax=Mycobacteroides abscessus TaxID=36809 RepID=UPI0009258719|nr:VOC family protein [Mycobacteroides abscessus]SHR99492.1 Glyoxalase-like domain [Mycobacteroides abscessus subsp. abscessus]
MRLSLIVIYVPEPSLDRTAAFYGALLDAAPVREQHGSGPTHWSVTGADGLVIEVYPATSRPHTTTRLEFRGADLDGAVQRLMDRAFALPERTRDGKGWWATDPCGNTVILLGVDAAEGATPPED